MLCKRLYNPKKQLPSSLYRFTKRAKDKRTREQGVTISDSMPVRAL